MAPLSSPADASLQGKSVLITGGAGFIGSHLAEELIKQGCTVRVLDDFSEGKKENVAFLKKEQIIKASVLDQKAVEAAMKDMEIVFHEAAQTSVQRSLQEPLLTNNTNVIGTLQVLMAARKAGVRKLILASSAAVYGNAGKRQCAEDMQPSPLSPYAASKASAEAYCTMYHHLYGLKTVCLRYFNVYGPRQDPRSEYTSVIQRFRECFAAGKQPTIFGDGEHVRDFVHVYDVVKANLLAAAGNVRGTAINIASGNAVTINSLINIFQEVTGKNLQPSHQEPRAGDIRYSLASIEKAKRLFGFAPSVSLRDGIQTLMNQSLMKRVI